MVANVPGAVYRGELSTDWAVQFMSDGVEGICGYPAADFLGHPPGARFASVIHPDDRELVEQAVEEALARREPYVIDYRIVHADGELRWVHERGRAVFDADGRALFLDGVLFDHTAQRRVEEQHRLLFEHNPQPMLAYDRETLGIVAASDAVCASYGYSREELLVDDVRDLVPPEDLPAVDRYLATAMSGEQPWPRPVTVRGATATRTAPSSTSRSPATTSRSTGALPRDALSRRDGTQPRPRRARGRA